MADAVVLVRDDREYLVRAGTELQTDLGVCEVPVDPQPGTTLETHLGEAFTVRSLRGPDLFEHFERTGAPMIPRDVGLVFGLTGVGQGDRALDAGTGTGVLAANLARAGATVVSYERDPNAAAVARENMALAGVEDSVTVRAGDIREALDGLERNGSFDVMTLDMGDAESVVERSQSLLVSGGFLASYSPFVEASRAVALAARKANLTDLRTVETVQREMDFDSRGSRPTTAPVGHTGYLTVGRRP